MSTFTSTFQMTTHHITIHVTVDRVLVLVHVLMLVLVPMPMIFGDAAMVLFDPSFLSETLTGHECPRLVGGLHS